MYFLEGILNILGLFPSKDLAESMSQSKTLTMMVMVGLILFGGFALFLFKMSQA